MLLATHAIVGAMAAELVPKHPVLGFALGFLSHFLLDSLPHYDYHLSSSVPSPDFRKRDILLGRRLLTDLVPLGLDTAGGFVLAAAIFNVSPWIALLGAAGGILPDALQFIYMKTRSRLLTRLQSFHSMIQSRNVFIARPFPGVLIQFAVIFLTGLALRYLKIL